MIHTPPFSLYRDLSISSLSLSVSLSLSLFVSLPLSHRGEQEAVCPGRMKPKTPAPQEAEEERAKGTEPREALEEGKKTPERRWEAEEQRSERTEQVP
jgi:hypothetical protein